MKVNMNRIQTWGSFIDQLAAGKYSRTNWSKFRTSIASRRQIGLVWTKLSNAERGIVQDADSSFIRVVVFALKNAGLFERYLKTGRSQPPEEWWWHVAKKRR